MNKDRALTLALALVCLFVVGSAAGSLESAVDSSPSEAIDLDYASLPIDKGQASDIKREYQSMTDDPQATPEETNQGSSDEVEPSSKSNGDGDDSSSSSSSKTEQSSGSGSEDPKNTLEQLLDALLAFLSTLVTYLVALVALVALAVSVRYRDEIATRVSPVFGRLRSSTADEYDSDDSRPPATPQNEVAEAWYEMVQRLKLDGEGPLTPRERAALARRNGADANTVWSLTELFEEVTYGGAPVTEDRRQRARQYLDRVRRLDRGGDS
ncbi:DUF4129 domain-containing protein [Haloferax sp. DFSO52]|uniref:DUF4129 domain-containing protein n=1 Tax=Haloferax sp. DFSO52 TaxID=3388505 RepID=UPI003A888712